MSIKLDSTLPDFTVPATSGKTVTLSELAGKKVVIYFYPKDHTPGCTTQGQDFRDLHEEFLAADTLVYAKGEVLGKPRDEADALRMIGLLRDDWHEVYTGVCVIDRSGHEHTGADKTAVHFMPISDDEIRA